MLRSEEYAAIKADYDRISTRAFPEELRAAARHELCAKAMPCFRRRNSAP